jgi:protein gp37
MFDDQAMNLGQRPGEVLFSILWVMMRANWHKCFVLTKQPQNMATFYREWVNSSDELDHIYWGISITDQEDADRMIPELLKIPGKKWISIEPMLSEIDLNEYLWQSCTVYWGPGEDDWGHDIEPREEGIEFTIIGCESGPKRRPLPLKWVRSLVTDLQDAQVPVFVKQLDINGKVVHDINQFPKELQIREWPE